MAKFNDVNEEKEKEEQLISKTESGIVAEYSAPPCGLAEVLLTKHPSVWQQIKKELYELKTKQESLYQEMVSERNKLSEMHKNTYLKNMVTTMSDYQRRIETVNMEMSRIYARTVKLKKRALHLYEKSNELKEKSANKDNGRNKD